MASARTTEGLNSLGNVYDANQLSDAAFSATRDLRDTRWSMAYTDPGLPTVGETDLNFGDDIGGIASHNDGSNVAPEEIDFDKYYERYMQDFNDEYARYGEMAGHSRQCDIGPGPHTPDDGPEEQESFEDAVEEQEQEGLDEEEDEEEPTAPTTTPHRQKRSRANIGDDHRPYKRHRMLSEDEDRTAAPEIDTLPASPKLTAGPIKSRIPAEQREDRLLHNKARSVKANVELPGIKRFWIGVLNPDTKDANVKRETDFIWMKGHGVSDPGSIRIVSLRDLR